MKLGDLIESNPPLQFDTEKALVMIDQINEDGTEGSGDLTYHGIKLSRVRVTQDDKGALTAEVVA